MEKKNWRLEKFEQYEESKKERRKNLELLRVHYRENPHLISDKEIFIGLSCKPTQTLLHSFFISKNLPMKRFPKAQSYLIALEKIIFRKKMKVKDSLLLQLSLYFTFNFPFSIISEKYPKVARKTFLKLFDEYLNSVESYPYYLNYMENMKYFLIEKNILLPVHNDADFVQDADVKNQLKKRKERD